VVSEVDVTRKL